ncbi:MAG: hypothetical protein Kow00114_12850 [Kiloniellaceae bacterium]
MPACQERAGAGKRSTVPALVPSVRLMLLRCRVLRLKMLMGLPSSSVLIATVDGYCMGVPRD